MSDKTIPFSVTINGEKELMVAPSAVTDLDILHDVDQLYHVLEQQKAYKAEIVDTNFADKTFVIKVNGNPYSVKIADKYDRLIKEIGLTIGQGAKANHIKSPMPGLVLSINVAVGDTLKKGETVLILEAMKMENLIKAPADVVVKSIKINQGQAVEKGQLLVEFE
jgi:biotin carboxyl carrier protein